MCCAQDEDSSVTFAASRRQGPRTTIGEYSDSRKRLTGNLHFKEIYGGVPILKKRASK